MIANSAWFPGGEPRRPDVLLSLRGFDAKGNRSGGIKHGFRVVVIPVGAILLRLHTGQHGIGDWWFTPYEYTRIRDHFDVGGAELAAGRDKGKSVFHAVLALLGEWYSNSPAQIGRFVVAVVREPLYAVYGEGDVATSGDFRFTLKPIALDAPGGGRIGARQVFMPECRQYADNALSIIPQSDVMTDTGLAAAVAAQSWSRLPFE